MPKMLEGTKAKKLAGRFISEKCRAAIATDRKAYIGFTTDVDDNGMVRVLAYGHVKGDPTKVSFVVIKERAVMLAAIKGEVPEGYGEKEEAEDKPTVSPVRAVAGKK